MKDRDFELATWVLTWAFAMLKQKDDIDGRISILRRCVEEWEAERAAPKREE